MSKNPSVGDKIRLKYIYKQLKEILLFSQNYGLQIINKMLKIKVHKYFGDALFCAIGCISILVKLQANYYANKMTYQSGMSETAYIEATSMTGFLATTA